jgi:hypothetical protein
VDIERLRADFRVERGLLQMSVMEVMQLDCKNLSAHRVSNFLTECPVLLEAETCRLQA